MNIRYIVKLSEEQRTRLHDLTGGGHARVRRVKRAQIVLAAEQGHGDAAVAAMVGVGTSTVYRTKPLCRGTRPKGGARLCHCGCGVRQCEGAGIEFGAPGAGNAGRV